MEVVMPRRVSVFVGLFMGAALLLLVGSGCESEEEAVDTAPTPTPDETCYPASINGRPTEVTCVTHEQYRVLNPPGAAPPPPTPAYSCIYAVVDGEAPCLPLSDARVADFEDCSPIKYDSRAACLPNGAEYGGTQHFLIIERGESVIRFGDGNLIYNVAPEDEPDFMGLKAPFRPPEPCRFTASEGESVCLNLTDPRVKDCQAVSFEGRSACLPPGAKLEVVDEKTPGVVDPGDGTYITLGDSVIMFIDGTVVDQLVTYSVEPEDESALERLSLLFQSAR
jgi:hypothetical protein